MANKILYNTVSGGEREGDYPSFVADPDFAIYSPKVSGRKIKFSKQLNEQEISDGYFFHETSNGEVRVNLDSYATAGVNHEYSLYFHPTMYDDGLIEDTWFFSWDQNNGLFLDNWSKKITIDRIFENEINETVDNDLVSVLDATSTGVGGFLMSSWFFLPNIGEVGAFGSGLFYPSGTAGWIYHLFFDSWVFTSILNDNKRSLWFFIPPGGSQTVVGGGVWMYASVEFLGIENRENSLTYLGSDSGDVKSGWLKWFDIQSTEYKAAIYSYSSKSWFGFLSSSSGDLFTLLSASEVSSLGVVNISEVPPSPKASFSVGATLLNENIEKKISHDNFGTLILGYPDFGSDGIWMFVQNKILEITELSSAVGWCWFSREYASGFQDSRFFWFADSGHMSQDSLDNIGTFTNRQCVLFFCQNVSSMCSAVVNTNGELFISIISDEQKTNYHKLVA